MILQTNGKWQGYGTGRIAKFTIHFPGEQSRYSSGELKLDMFRKVDYIRGLNCKARGWFYIELLSDSVSNVQEYKLEFRKDLEYYMWLWVRPQFGGTFPQRITIKVWTPGALVTRPTLVPFRSNPGGFSMFVPDDKP